MCCLQVHKGVSGFVRSTIGHPIADTKVIVEGIQHVVKSGKGGDYYRILLPGLYNITFTAFGYESYTTTIVTLQTASPDRLTVQFYRSYPKVGRTSST